MHEFYKDDHVSRGVDVELRAWYTQMCHFFYRAEIPPLARYFVDSSMPHTVAVYQVWKATGTRQGAWIVARTENNATTDLFAVYVLSNVLGLHAHLEGDTLRYCWVLFNTQL